MALYKIESMYGPMADAVLEAAKEKRPTRWMASVCFWMGRQQIYNAQDYWYALAAKVTTLIGDDFRAQVEEQLSKQEDLLFENVGDWPEIPDNLARMIAEWEPKDPDEGVDIEALRAESVIKVDRAAEAFRMNFITPGYGQIMTYQQKLAEAEAKVANGSIADSEIPHIVAEAAATGQSKAEAAQSIIATFNGWKKLSAGIEGKRMAAKAAIAAAETVADIRGAATVDWAGQE